MVDGSNLLIFSITTFVVVIAPGPGMLYVISRAIMGGRKMGIISAFGTSVGIAIHILAASFGLSLIIYASDIGYQITKWAGGIYLLFLAWKTITQGQNLTMNSGKTCATNSAVFWQGVLVNAINPKVALFFMAFIPQFINPSLGSIAAQTFTLGMIFLCLTVVVFSAYALSATIIGKWIIERRRVKRVIDWSMGTLFVYLGLRLAFSSRQ